MINIILLLFLLLIYFIPINEYFANSNENEDIYNYKTSLHFKQMFEQPTLWLGYQDFDGSSNYNKVFINNFENSLFKEKIL
jgi:hypothetical protein